MKQNINKIENAQYNELYRWRQVLGERNVNLEICEIKKFIKTEYGWLLIYHGVEPLNKGRLYHAGAALLSKNDPTKVIARLPYPLFSPSKPWERQGHVHNVVFPTGTAQFKDRLYIYYGAADSYVACASIRLPQLLKEILKYKKGYTYTLHRKINN